MITQKCTEKRREANSVKEDQQRYMFKEYRIIFVRMLKDFVVKYRYKV
jgi:hypothetical protein